MIAIQNWFSLGMVTLLLVLTSGCQSAQKKENADIAQVGATMHNSVGMEAFAKGQYASAEQRFLLALKLKPDSIDAMNNLGRTYYMMGKFGNAMTSLNAALALAEKENNQAMQAAIHSNIGDIHRQSERYDEALASYHKVLTILPDEARIHYEIGNLYNKKGEYQEALWRFEKVLELDINFIMARQGKALAYYMMGKPKDAWREAMLVEKAGYELNEDFRKSIVEKLKEERDSKDYRPGS